MESREINEDNYNKPLPSFVTQCVMNVLVGIDALKRTYNIPRIRTIVVDTILSNIEIKMQNIINEFEIKCDTTMVDHTKSSFTNLRNILKQYNTVSSSVGTSICSPTGETAEGLGVITLRDVRSAFITFLTDILKYENQYITPDIRFSILNRKKRHSKMKNEEFKQIISRNDVSTVMPKEIFDSSCIFGDTFEDVAIDKDEEFREPDTLMSESKDVVHTTSKEEAPIENMKLDNYNTNIFQKYFVVRSQDQHILLYEISSYIQYAFSVIC